MSGESNIDLKQEVERSLILYDFRSKLFVNNFKLNEIILRLSIQDILKFSELSAPLYGC